MDPYIGQRIVVSPLISIDVVKIDKYDDLHVNVIVELTSARNVVIVRVWDDDDVEWNPHVFMVQYETDKYVQTLTVNLDDLLEEKLDEDYDFEIMSSEILVRAGY